MRNKQRWSADALWPALLTASLADLYLTGGVQATVREQLWGRAAAFLLLAVVFRCCICVRPAAAPIDWGIAFVLSLALSQYLCYGWEFYVYAFRDGQDFWIFAGLCLLLAWYGAQVRPRAVARTAPLLLALAVLGLILLIASLADQMDPLRLLENDGFGREGFWASFRAALRPLPEMLLLAWLGEDARRRRRDVVCYFAGLMAAHGWLVVMQTLVLGAYPDERPLHRLSSLGELSVFTRLDGLFVMLWLLLYFMKCLLYGSCIARALRTGEQKRRGFQAMVWLVIGGLAAVLYTGRGTTALAAATSVLLVGCAVYMLIKRGGERFAANHKN